LLPPIPLVLVLVLPHGVFAAAATTTMLTTFHSQKHTAGFT